jgi:hypothetical protein
MRLEYEGKPQQALASYRRFLALPYRDRSQDFTALLFVDWRIRELEKLE